MLTHVNVNVNVNVSVNVNVNVFISSKFLSTDAFMGKLDKKIIILFLVINVSDCLNIGIHYIGSRFV